MSEMTLNEIKEMKVNLEEDIKEKIYQFVSATGLYIEGVNVSFFKGGHGTFAVDVKIELGGI